MREEIEALRSMLKDVKAKADRYEAVLTTIATGPLMPSPDGRACEEAEEFEERVQKMAKEALEWTETP